MQNLAALIATAGATLYDTELTSENGRTIYRVYITKPRGVTLDDCEAVSRLISPILDVEPPVGGEYFLEVSSPGLERKLTKPEHFAASTGELLKITLNDKTKLTGLLKSANEETIVLNIDSADGESAFALDSDAAINIADIKKARTYIKW